MCGIAGIVAGVGGRVDGDVLRRMTRTLAARGPDGEGFHLAPGVGLGHRRLAVIDVEGGAQPLRSEDGAVVVVANGEIYNFAALRGELESVGHRFATGSDSEVLVHGYEQWGWAGLLDRIEGMFGFALWDEGDQTLHLARDRLGEKPLYWAALPDGGLAFASELRALGRCPGVDRRVDPASLARYLVYEYVPSPATIVRGAAKLPAATCMTFRRGSSPRVETYWDLPMPGADGAPPRHERDAERASRRLLAELRRSVRERLVSDVPLGVFLSGGVDSSAVAALAAEVRGGELETFCIGFGDATFDETAEARAVAEALGTRHHEDRLSPRLVLDLVPAMGDLLDEPLGDGSLVPTHLLSRFARQHVTVALGGDGGDDLLMGYPTFQAERLARWLVDPQPPVLRRTTLAAGRAASRLLPVSHLYMSFDFRLKQFLKGAADRGAVRHQQWLGSLSPHEALAALRRDVAAEAGSGLHDVVRVREERCPSRDPWDRLTYFYVKGYLGENVLTKVDRASMAVALEVRAPFLDRGVVAAACEAAPELRMRGLATKHLLKRALRGIVPDRTLTRPKKGFGMPIGRWLRGELRPLLEEELSEDRIRADGLLDPRPIRSMVDEHVRGVADHRKPLWTLLAFQGWHRSWRAVLPGRGEG